MVRRRKRLALYVASFVVVTATYTVLYQQGMARLEGEEWTLLESLEVVAHSFTTTGYPEGVSWESPAMRVLAMLAQVTGIAYIFVAIPLFIVPWLQEEVSPVVPQSTTAEDHVLVCGHTPSGEAIGEELKARGHEYVILEPEEGTARGLYQDGEPVVYGDPHDPEALSNANVGAARAVVIDETEDEYVDAILSVRERNEETRVICLVEEPSRARYLRYAGATTIMSPKHRLGKSLADRLHSVVSVGDGIGEGVEVAEFPIGAESELCGRPFEECLVIEEEGASILGAWLRGDFVTDVAPEEYVDENTSLLVAGPSRALEAVAERTYGKRSRATTDHQRVIVAGRGVAGLTATAILQGTALSLTVVDIEEKKGVDVVGDVTEEATWREADIASADAAVITMTDDRQALQATLVARALDEEIELVVAANAVENTSRFYQAGADYVLSLPKVSGRMVALDVFEENVMGLPERLRFARTTLSGPVGADDRESVSVVAVERDGDLLEGETELRADDRVVVAGTEGAVRAFVRAHGES